MIAPIRELQSLVLNPDTWRPSDGQTDPFLVRIRGALGSLREHDDQVGSSDLAALVRQGILRCHLARNEVAELRVPNLPPWPDEPTWRLFNCTPTRIDVNHLLVRPERWNPAWLDATATQVVEHANAEVLRRVALPLTADPCLTEHTGLTQYFSRGQRDAVRGALLIPAGTTLIISLPTGAGKTLAFQLPSLMWASEGGLSLVIVPTTALARDQEERFRDLLRLSPAGKQLARKAFAYHSGLTNESKKEILNDVRSGSIPIIFASPEAVLGALRTSLFEAARQGRLRFFVLDEAHVVSQWGQQFRPEFQSIAGLRDSLLEECPADGRFRTLLLTGTLTTESFQTLRQIFGGDDCQIVAEPALRSEPGFLIDSAYGEEQRRVSITEAIRFLPRPMILYTTLRKDASDWESTLRAAGYRRLRLVRGGDLAGMQGEQLLHDWRNRAVDIMVATSAFGLGVDQAEVRTVIHACLPETIDRYYQEVGRAGRDGNASVALLVTTPTDLKTARNLSQEKLISVDRGFERWEEMWIHRHSGTGDRHILSLDARPPDIGEPGMRNSSWNLRTLVLMARARLIQFSAHLPPSVDRHADEDELSFQERRQKELQLYFTEVAIRILDPKVSKREHWEVVVDRARTDLRRGDTEGLKLLEELINLPRPLNEIFRDVYTLYDPFIRPPHFIGSCPVTRRDGTVGFESTEPDTLIPDRLATSVSPGFLRALVSCHDHTGRAWVKCASSRENSRLQRDTVLQFLRYFAAAGGCEFSLPDGYLRKEEWRQLREQTPVRFLIRTPIDAPAEDPFQSQLSVPRITLVAEAENDPALLKRILQVRRPLHIIVLSSLAVDPDRPPRRLLDIKPGLPLETVMDRLAL